MGLRAMPPPEGPARAALRFGYRTARRSWFALRAPRDRGAVAFIGDSIVEEWRDLASHFPGLKTANRGIMGDTARGVASRLRADALALLPAAVVLLAGTNDLAAGEPPERVAADLSRAVAECAPVPVLVCRVLPRSPGPGLFPDAVLRLNRLLDGIPARAPRAAVCDSFSPLADGGGSCREEFFRDGLHLNAAGYRRLAEVAAPALDALLRDSAG